jgi:hypothetical protein
LVGEELGGKQDRIFARGETVDRWQNMITILRYDRATLKAAVANYLSIVRAYMGLDDHPVWIKPTHGPHHEAVATRLVLRDPHGTDGEYVVVYFFHDPGKPVYAVAFSQHLPLPSGEIPTKNAVRALARRHASHARSRRNALGPPARADDRIAFVPGVCDRMPVLQGARQLGMASGRRHEKEGDDSQTRA